MAEEFAGTEHIKLYSEFRKNTPGEVIDKIILHLKKKYNGPLDLAVDVGCGSGQSSVNLASFFKEIHGIDGSETQINEAEDARKLTNIFYKIGPAEVLPFPDGSVQLITVGTALHWFDLGKFFPEAWRILSNNGTLSVYGYISVKPLFKNPVLIEEVNELYSQHYKNLNPYFKPQVNIIYQKYETVNFPFEEVIREPEIRTTYLGKLSDIVGYITSYSSIQNCRKEDHARADEIVNDFQSRLYEIGAKENVKSEQVITLYRDYMLINCRKVIPSAS